MKSKLLIVVFVAILLCSALNVAPAIAQCPTCNGTGKVPCPECNGTGKIATVTEGTPCEACSGTGTLPPDLVATIHTTQPISGKISVTAIVQNNEDVAAYGNVTVKVESGQYYAVEATSNREEFPPHVETKVTVIIEDIPTEHYDQIVEKIFIGSGDEGGTIVERLRSTSHVSVSLSDVENVVCRYCNGTGVGSITRDCPRCGGTGFIDCPTCSASDGDGGEQNGNLDIGGAVYGVAAVVVVAGVAIAAFVVVKKRTVKEEDIKKLPPTDFQNWVLKRIGGKSSSQSDARMGIDGYTIEGQPISIKQADGVDRNAIENFAAAMGHHNAKNGTIVAFSFSDDAIRGRVRAKMAYGREIQLVTVKELIANKSMTL
jgi:hypothetical protein